MNISNDYLITLIHATEDQVIWWGLRQTATATFYEWKDMCIIVNTHGGCTLLKKEKKVNITRHQEKDLHRLVRIIQQGETL